MTLEQFAVGKVWRREYLAIHALYTAWGIFHLLKLSVIFYAKYMCVVESKSISDK